MTMTDAAVNPQRVDEFAGEVLEKISSASIVLVLSIGHRTGLFDVMAHLPPSTSGEIAQAAGLNERYVREWLAAMLVGHIVESDPDSDTWWLPSEHAAVLTRDSGTDNLARLAQIVGMLASVEHQVADCFRHGGGVAYREYPEFHALMAEDSKEMAEGILVDQVVPLVDGLAERLTSGIEVADVGCGSGHHLNVLARAFPESKFIGFDFSEEAIAQARVGSADIGNLEFELRDVADLSGAGPFDFITAFDAIHDQARPAAVLEGIANALAPGGVFLMVDIAASSEPHENAELPHAGFLYGVSLLHCMTVSLALGGAGLGTVWGEQTAVRMLAEAGFGDVHVRHLEADPFNSYYVATSA